MATQMVLCSGPHCLAVLSRPIEPHETSRLLRGKGERDPEAACDLAGGLGGDLAAHCCSRKHSGGSKRLLGHKKEAALGKEPSLKAGKLPYEECQEVASYVRFLDVGTNVNTGKNFRIRVARCSK